MALFHAFIRYVHASFCQKTVANSVIMQVGSDMKRQSGRQRRAEGTKEKVHGFEAREGISIKRERPLAQSLWS